jgi:hypothetical protein
MHQEPFSVSKETIKKLIDASTIVVAGIPLCEQWKVFTGWGENAFINWRMKNGA